MFTHTRSSLPTLLLPVFLCLLGTTFAAFTTPANVFSGCATTLPGAMTSVSINGNTTAFTSATQCNTACVSVSGATHSYYQPSSGQCQCTAKYQYPSQNDFGNMDACNSPNDWDTRLTGTSYHYVGCYANKPSALTNNIPKTGPNGCLLNCGKSLQAGFFITTTAGNNNYGCYCGEGDYTNPVQCGPGTYFVYQHSVLDASQGLARRKREEKAKREEKKFQPCPTGLTACVVPGFTADVYECIDIQNDLESCGGCLQEQYYTRDSPLGQDCSKHAAVGYSTCRKGQCQISKCKKGFALHDGKCVKKLHRTQRSTSSKKK